MKKILKLAVFAMLYCILLAENTQAQARAFGKGVKNTNLGFGLGRFYGSGVNASFNFGLSDLISVGVFGDFSSKNHKHPFNPNVIPGQLRETFIGTGLRVDAHLGKFINKGLCMSNNKFDPYAGLQLGVLFKTLNFTVPYATDRKEKFYSWGLHVGARYYFNDILGAFLEGGVPYSSVGLSLKF